MTALHFYLEDFGSSARHLNPSAFSDEMLENERLEAFDKGYRAGWDDAISAKADEGSQLSTDFAQNLQDLSFTFHEVHAQVLSNLAPLFEEILQKLLPTLARDTLGAHVADQLSQMARDIGTATVEIAVAQGASETVSQLVNEAACGLPLTVREVADLQEGQAELRFGGREISVDLANVTSQVTEAVHAVLFETPERQANG